MIIAKCPICGKTKKTYYKCFNCCSVKHNSFENQINKPQSQKTSTQEGSVAGAHNLTSSKPENLESSASQIQEQSSQEPVNAQNPQKKEVSGFIDNHQQKQENREKTLSSPVSESELEIEEEKIEPKKKAEDYKFQCGSCYACFDEHENKCPHCGVEL